MQSLSLVLKNRGPEGEALPQPFEVFDELSVKFKRSQVSMIAAAPGGGKSALACYIATRMYHEEDRGVPALYYCADSDSLTVAATIVAPFLDITINEAEYRLTQGDEWALRVLEQETQHIWFCFRRGPTLNDILTEIKAYAHVYGEYPSFIIIDNLKNIAEQGEEVTKYNVIMPSLQELAGDANAHVMVLHHVTGQYSNGDKPIPRDGIKYKPDDVASLTLSLWRPEPGFMGFCVIKSRSGPADPTAQNIGGEIPWDGSRGWFG